MVLLNLRAIDYKMIYYMNLHIKKVSQNSQGIVYGTLTDKCGRIYVSFKMYIGRFRNAVCTETERKGLILTVTLFIHFRTRHDNRLEALLDLG